MDKQMLYIQVDSLRFILKDLEENERPKAFIIEDLKETIEMFRKLLGDNFNEC